MESFKGHNIDRLAKILKGCTRSQIKTYLVQCIKLNEEPADSRKIGSVLDSVIFEMRTRGMDEEDIRKELRTNSPIESMVEKELRILDLPYRRQIGIGRYTVDFLIESKGKKVVLECNGHNYHRYSYAQIKRDRKRDKFLESEGFFVLRYSGSRIHSNPATPAKHVKKILEEDSYSR